MLLGILKTSIGESLLGFVASLCGGIIGFFVVSLFSMLTMYICSRIYGKYGTKVRMFHILCWTWNKNYYQDENNPDNYIKTKTRLSFFCNATVQTISLTKEQKKSFIRLDMIIEMSFMFLFGSLFGYLYYITKIWALKYFFFGLCCAAFILLFMVIVSKMRYNKARAYLLELSESFFTADENTKFPLIPWNQFLEMKPLITEKVSYAVMCYVVAEQENNLPILKEIIKNTDDIDYRGLNPTFQLRLNSLRLLYYSFREIDPEKATRYYNYSKDSFDKDPDCNGRRKLAYYAYYILHDEAAAAKYVEQGIKAVDKYDPLRTRYENELERKMLLFLKEQLESGASAGTTEG